MLDYTHVGEINRTDGQIKKHHTMFKETEFNLLRNILKGMSVTPSSHVTNKRIARKNHIKNALSKYSIIEFNNTNSDCRVLIRGRKVETLEDLRDYNLCLVISLTRAKIVTVYYNLYDDKHNSINMNRYSDFDILQYM